MHYSLILSTLLGLTLASPTPQLIDTAGVEAAPDPVFVTPAYNVAEEAGATPVPAISARDRIHKRDGTCAAQPAGSGPVSSPDTAEAFLANPVYAETANTAITPDGYSMVMKNGDGSLSASNYMGLRTLKSYDTMGCASLCDQATGCQAFNMYIERDPTLDPSAVNCPNPPSLTNYKCTLWGAVVSEAQATNKGQWRNSFQVVITGSNAYNKATPPSEISCYKGPTSLGGAINAPLDTEGKNTYMGYKYHPFSQTQGYDPSTCAADCNSQTAYNSRHPAADGSYQSCIFFNAYVLSMNGVPQGLYCSMYSQVWAASYATNYGQYRGTDRYTVSRSYSYSLEAENSVCGPIKPSQSTTSISSTTSLSSTTSSSSSSSSSTMTTEETSSSTSSLMTTEETSSSTPSPTTSSSSTSSSETTTSGSSTFEASTSSSSVSSTMTTTSLTSPTPTSTTSSSSSSSTSTTTSAAAAPTDFCLQNPKTGDYASLTKGGNGLSFFPTSAKQLPSLFTLDSYSILTSVKTNLIASLNLATYGKDGKSEGHILGTSLALATKNPNFNPLQCDVWGETLVCRSAANYLDPVAVPAARSELKTTTKGNDGVDRFVFAPTTVMGAVNVRVVSGERCGPDYS